MNLFGEVVVTMLVILDPPGNTPIFLAVTQRLTEKERHKAAYLAIGTAFLVISIFAIGGQTILDYLNVSVPAPTVFWAPTVAKFTVTPTVAVS